MTHTTTQRSIFLALIAVLLSGGAYGASAQAVRGVVIDDQSLSGVGTATVRLVQGGKPGRGTETDAQGRFFLALPGGGAYRLQVSRIGYRTTRSQMFDVGRHDTISVEFRIAPHAVLLDPIVVTARSRSGRSIFEERRKDWGKGIYLTPYQIDSMNLRAPADIFRKMPEVKLQWSFGERRDGSRGEIPTVVSELGPGCMLYMVNRVWVEPPPWADSAQSNVGWFSDEGAAKKSKEDWSSYQLAGLLPEDIAAVEVYRTIAEVPPSLRRFTHDYPWVNCGLVVIWTKSAW